MPLPCVKRHNPHTSQARLPKGLGITRNFKFNDGIYKGPTNGVTNESSFASNSSPKLIMRQVENTRFTFFGWEKNILVIDQNNVTM